MAPAATIMGTDLRKLGPSLSSATTSAYAATKISRHSSPRRSRVQLRL